MRLEIYDGWNGEKPSLVVKDCSQEFAWETVSRIMLNPKGLQSFHKALFKICLPGDEANEDDYFTLWEVSTRHQ